MTIELTPHTITTGNSSEFILEISNPTQASATGLTFAFTLPQGIMLASPAILSNSCGGTLTAPNGGSVVNLVGGQVGAGETCSLRLGITAASPGSFEITTGPLSSSAGSSVGATSTLEVIDPDTLADLSFTKEFPSDPVSPGDTTTLEFTITNHSATESYSSITFADDLDAALPGLVATSVPTVGGTILEATFGSTGAPLLIGGIWDYFDRIENELGRNDSYPVDASGTAWNAVEFDLNTSTIGNWSSGSAPLQSGLIDGFPSDLPDSLFGIDAAPDGTSNLVTTYLFRHDFSLTPDQADVESWLIEYLLDDGGIVYVNGVEVFRTPSMPVGIVDTTTLAEVGNEAATSFQSVNLQGLLVPGANTIAVELHQSTLDSSDVGFFLELLPAADSPTAGFSYVDDTFNGTDDADNSDGSVDPFGGSPGGALTIETGGQGFLDALLGASSSGAWVRTVTVPEAITSTISFDYRIRMAGEYDSGEFSQVLFTLNGAPLGFGAGGAVFQLDGADGDGAADDSGWRSFTRSIDLQAGTNTIQLGVYNNSSTQTSEVTNVWFDNVFLGTPEEPAPICGPGSSLTGTDVLTLAGGTLGPGQSCRFRVEVEVPASTPVGTYRNITSLLSTVAGGNPLVALPATDVLQVRTIPPGFSKAFSPAAVAGDGVSTLTYLVTNNERFLPIDELSFTEVLPSGFVIANPSNATSTCPGGTLTAVPGTNLITLQGGSTAAGATCAISVDVQARSTPGDYVAQSGDLTSSLGNSGTATSTLTVVPPPLFSKAFLPTTFNAGQVGTLTFTIDNSSSTLDATGLRFTDTLPAGLRLSDQVNLSTTCLGGSVSANPGGGFITYSGGTVPAGAICSFTVEVTATEGGSYENVSGDLTSSLGNSGPAAATLVVQPIVSVTLDQTNSLDPVVAGSGPGNLTFILTATNDGPSTATGLAVREALTLPAGVTVQEVTSSDGTAFNSPTWTIDRLPPGTSATLTVVLTVDSSTASGDEVISGTATLEALNELNNVTGGSTASTSSSVVRAVDLEVVTTESIDPVIAGSSPGNLTYRTTVTNRGPSDATGIEISNVLNFPPGVAIESVLAEDTTTYADSLWTIPSLPAGETATLSTVLSASPGAPMEADAISSSSSVSAVTEPDADEENDATVVLTSIRREIDLGVSIAESRDPVLAGFADPGNLSHVISVTNAGPSDGEGVALDLQQVLPAGVTVEEILPGGGTSWSDPTWTVGTLHRGETASFLLNLTVPGTVAGGADVLRTSAMVSSAREPLVNPQNDSASASTSIASPLAVALEPTPITYDIQTGLFKQRLRVSNNNPDAVPAFRILVGGLPANVTVHNAQSSAGEDAAILYNQALAPGASIDLVVEYYQPTASGDFEPSFEITLLDTLSMETAEEGLMLDRVFALPNGDMALEFASEIGAIYTIQYSHNGTDWHNVAPNIIAGGTRRQWIDNGPPKTPSHPSTVESRLYRVFRYSKNR